MDLFQIIPMLISLIGGGLAGGAYTYWRNARDARQKAQAQETATIASLNAELSYIQRLERYNAGSNGEGDKPFIQFPTTVAVSVTFQQRQLYPKLRGLQDNLASHTLALIHVNQIIDLRHQLFIASRLRSDMNIDAQLSSMRDCIHNICKGETKLGNIGIDNPADLPAITAALLEGLQVIGFNEPLNYS